MRRDRCRTEPPDPEGPGDPAERAQGDVPVGDGQVVVEVLAGCAHAADVQGDPGPGQVAGGRRVLADGQQPAGGDPQRPEGRVAAGGTLRQWRPPDVLGLLGDEQGGQLAVGDLCGHPDVGGAEGGHVERDLGADRPGQDLHGLAEAAGAGHVGDAVVVDGLAAQDQQLAENLIAGESVDQI